METHSLKLLFHPFAVSGKGELKMLLLNLNVVEMFIIKVKHTSGEGNGNPLQYSCLENSMDKGGWQATVHGVTKSQTQPSDYHRAYQRGTVFELHKSCRVI